MAAERTTVDSLTLAALQPSAASWLVLATALAAALLAAVYKRWRFVDRVGRVPGPPAPWPLIGNALDIFRDPDDLFDYLVTFVGNWRKQYPVLRFWAGPFPMLFLYTPEATEVLLSSNKLIEKSREYQFLQPWLNEGLLTSTGGKWHSRRKMLTPAFHFKILEDFVDVFNEQSRILVQKLTDAHRLQDDAGFNIFPFITRCTLDIICDSAMGRHVDAQSKETSEYVQAVCAISRVVQTRQIRPWLQPEFLFKLSPMARTQADCLRILHGFTDMVIKERKIEHQVRKEEAPRNNNDDPKDDISLSKKRRLAFLDLLIEASNNGQDLSDQDIREEVDTFMFEGHDTTAAGVSWCIYLIGRHPHVQERLDEELRSVFGDSDRCAEMADLPQLKYLECCIKEALRLFPSVPMFSRILTQDTTFHGYEMPAGSTVAVIAYMLHRDPAHFPNPEQYDPDRFLAENVRGRHAFSYVPFSAGPRNCIGQKYAMMTQKVLLSTLFRNFAVESLDRLEDMTLLGELVLRPKQGVRVKLTPKTLK